VNARDAMPEGGRLIIETGNVDLDPSHGISGSDIRPGPYVMLAVTDTGHGMDEATKSRIFEPFFTTKERGKGTGMGLPTVYGIVQQSGGYIWVYSELGRGTTFKIYLPEFQDAAAQPVERPMLRTAPGGDETILLVEDEDLVRALARRMLESHGYRVLEARSGHEALLISQSHAGPIDLLITDVIMPGIGGRQLAHDLAKQRPATRVMFVSGYTDNTISDQGAIDSHIAFLQKPFSHESLTNKVRQVLDDPQYAAFPGGGDAASNTGAPGKSGGESSSPRR
jgi:CheY-like chemotaxis protein